MRLIRNLLLLAITLFLFSCHSYSEQANTCTVTRIVDADTLYCSQGYGKELKIRLIGVDAPESKRNSKTYKDAKKTGESVKSIVELGNKSTTFVKSRLTGFRGLDTDMNMAYSDTLIDPLFNEID